MFRHHEVFQEMFRSGSENSIIVSFEFQDFHKLQVWIKVTFLYFKIFLNMEKYDEYHCFGVDKFDNSKNVSVLNLY